MLTQMQIVLNWNWNIYCTSQDVWPDHYTWVINDGLLKGMFVLQQLLWIPAECPQQRMPDIINISKHNKNKYIDHKKDAPFFAFLVEVYVCACKPQVNSNPQALPRFYLVRRKNERNAPYEINYPILILSLSKSPSSFYPVTVIIANAAVNF